MSNATRSGEWTDVTEQQSRPAKRHVETVSSMGSRSKRSKYTLAACDPCKRRKLKCLPEDGSTSCQRCRASGIECVISQLPRPQVQQRPHDDNDERIRRVEDRLESLQNQFNVLQQALRTEKSRIGQAESSSATRTSDSQVPSEQRIRSGGHRRLAFLGPTRPEYNFVVARSSLHERGLSTDLPAFDVAASPSVTSSDTTATSEPDRDFDQLRHVSRSEVLRLVKIFREEINLVYPLLDMDELTHEVVEHFDDWKSGEPATLQTHMQKDQAFDKTKVSLLKMVVAIAKVIEALGGNDFSRNLAESVEGEVFGVAISATVLYHELPLATLLSIYYFFTDEELLAWRNIGFAVRMALELGLHRRDTLMNTVKDPRRRFWAIRLFWCIYALDRRWSLGIGLPFALQDSDIDPQLPEPDSGVEFLRCLVRFGRICSNLWQVFPKFGPSSQPIPKESVFYLEFQIEKWLESIPEYLRLEPLSQERGEEPQDRIVLLQRVFLYLRGNHARLLLHRHHILSARDVEADSDAAQNVVNIAKDTIHHLVHLNDNSDIYARQQVAWNHYLVGALAAVFLAVCHSPTLFADQCRESFYSGVDLVRRFSVHSLVSRRLWKSVQCLLPEARKLGLQKHDGEPQTHSVRSQSPPDHAVHNKSQENSAGRNSDEPLPLTMQNDAQYGLDSHLHDTWQFGTLTADIGPVQGLDTLPDMSQMTDNLTNFYEVFGNTAQDRMMTQMDTNPHHGAAQSTDRDQVSLLFQDFISW